jgi:Zn-dependent peptidase ImmA (M78 family)/DNA-binding XRE family transcriptional regulator
MPPLQRAHVKPILLSWAREQSHYTTDAAAKKIGVSASAVASWESGESEPTIRQLRKAAHVYHYSLAVFYLSEPPGDTFKPIRDYRRFAGHPSSDVSPQLHLAIRDSYDRRLSTLDLYQLLDEQPADFRFRASLTDDPERAGESLRHYLDVTDAEQRRWRKPETAFAAIRAKLEHCGVLVFQLTRIPKDEVRGLAIGEFPLPAIVVNRSDAAAGRLFSLLHEATHLGLRMGGVCNLAEEHAWRPGTQAVEPFCNRVAAAALVPERLFLGHAKVREMVRRTWTVSDLDPLARDFAVSTQVVARRLLTFRVIDQRLYESLIAELDAIFAALPKRKGHLSPAQNVVSLGGNVFASLVLQAFGRDRISASTVASYFGVQLKHVPEIRHAVEHVV